MEDYYLKRSIFHLEISHMMEVNGLTGRRMNRSVLSCCHIQYLILHEMSCISGGQRMKTEKHWAFNIGGIWAVLLFCLRPHTAVQSLHHSSGAQPEKQQLETLSELQLYRDSHDSVPLSPALSASLSLINLCLCVRIQLYQTLSWLFWAFLIWNPASEWQKNVSQKHTAFRTHFTLLMWHIYKINKVFNEDARGFLCLRNEMDVHLIGWIENHKMHQKSFCEIMWKAQSIKTFSI